MKKDFLYEADILIVDDQPGNLRVLSAILEGQGYGVRKAISGQAAIEAIRARMPDIVLLDVNMPDMNGFQVCAYLKNDREFRDVPVIFVSGLSDVGDKLQGFQCGAVDYVTKPYQQEEIMARLRTHITMNRQQRQIDRLAHELSQSNETLAVQNAELELEIAERKRVEISLQKANHKLEALALRDGLTQIANRRCFDMVLHQEWERAKREKTTLCLLMCDIDYFKKLNDAYGHQKGDDCLIRIAQAIRSTVKRPADMTARYGGEEFAILLPGTPLEGGVQVAAEIEQNLAALMLPHPASPTGYVTLSIGVSCCAPGTDLLPEALIRSSDEALYRAKDEGRNRIFVAGETRTKDIERTAFAS